MFAKIVLETQRQDDGFRSKNEEDLFAGGRIYRDAPGATGRTAHADSEARIVRSAGGQQILRR